MRKTFLIIGMVLALLNVTYSFFRTEDTAILFGIEMNIWVYRFIWFAMAALLFNGYRKEQGRSS